MVRAAERGANAVPSSLAAVERTLDRTIEALSSGAHTREARALMIEARRLRNVVANWRSIPPPPDVHDEMLERVGQLAGAVGIAFPDAAGERAVERAAEPEPDGYPHIIVDDPRVEVEGDAYSLDFEPHLYSLEGDTSARREAIPWQAPPQRSEPTTGARGAAQLRRQSVPPPAWSPATAAPMPVLEDDDAPHVVRPPQPPAPEEPPATQPRPRLRPASDSPAAPRPSPAAPRPASMPPPALLEPITRPSLPPLVGGASSPPPPARESWFGAPGLPRDLGHDPADGEPLGVARTVVTAVAVTMSDPVDPLLMFLTEPYSPRADAYRGVRRKLTSSGNPRVIGITSAHAGEGKTTLAANLALTLREGGRGQVLLIEANLVAPSFTRLFGFPPPVCVLLQLAQHLEDPRAPWIAAEPMARLHVMGIDATVKHPPLLDSVSFSTGMARLVQAGYEYIIVDSPPVLGSVNCNVITDSVEGMIFSALPMISRRKEMRKAVEQLEPAACFGVVVLDA